MIIKGWVCPQMVNEKGQPTVKQNEQGIWTPWVTAQSYIETLVVARVKLCHLLACEDMLCESHLLRIKKINTVKHFSYVTDIKIVMAALGIISLKASRSSVLLLEWLIGWNEMLWHVIWIEQLRKYDMSYYTSKLITLCYCVVFSHTSKRFKINSSYCVYLWSRDV